MHVGNKPLIELTDILVSNYSRYAYTEVMYMHMTNSK